MASYDEENQFHGDKFDKKTRVKTAGFFDYMKVEEWSNVLKRTFERRLQRKRESSAGQDFFARRSTQALPKPIEESETEKKQHFSHKSLQLFEAIDTTNKMSEKVEL